MRKLLLLAILALPLAACSKPDDASSPVAPTTPPANVNVNPPTQSTVPGGGSLANPKAPDGSQGK